MHSFLSWAWDAFNFLEPRGAHSAYLGLTLDVIKPESFIRPCLRDCRVMADPNGENKIFGKTSPPMAGTRHDCMRGAGADDFTSFLLEAPPLPPGHGFACVGTCDRSSPHEYFPHKVGGPNIRWTTPRAHQGSKRIVARSGTRAKSAERLFGNAMVPGAECGRGAANEATGAVSG